MKERLLRKYRERQQAVLSSEARRVSSPLRGQWVENNAGTLADARRVQEEALSGKAPGTGNAAGGTPVMMRSLDEALQARAEAAPGGVQAGGFPAAKPSGGDALNRLAEEMAAEEVARGNGRAFGGSLPSQGLDGTAGQGVPWVPPGRVGAPDALRAWEGTETGEQALWRTAAEMVAEETAGALGNGGMGPWQMERMPGQAQGYAGRMAGVRGVETEAGIETSNADVAGESAWPYGVNGNARAHQLLLRAAYELAGDRMREEAEEELALLNRLAPKWGYVRGDAAADAWMGPGMARETDAERPRNYAEPVRYSASSGMSDVPFGNEPDRTGKTGGVQEANRAGDLDVMREDILVLETRLGIAHQPLPGEVLAEQTPMAQQAPMAQPGPRPQEASPAPTDNPENRATVPETAEEVALSPEAMGELMQLRAQYQAMYDTQQTELFEALGDGSHIDPDFEEKAAQGCIAAEGRLVVDNPGFTAALEEGNTLKALLYAVTGPSSPGAYLTEQEQKNYYYLWQEKGPEAAEAYLRHMKPTQRQRETEGLLEAYAATAEEYPVLASLASIPLTMAEGIGGAYAIGATILGKEIDLNNPAMMPIRIKEAIRESVVQGLHSGVDSAFWGDALADFYEDLMATGDVAFMLLFTPVLGLGGVAAVGATNGFTTSVLRVLEEGGTEGEALIAGTMAGLTEYLLSTMGRSAFNIGDPAAWSAMAMEFLKRQGINLGERALEELAGYISGALGNGEADYEASVRGHMEAGLSEEEARELAGRELAELVGMAVLAGTGGDGATEMEVYGRADGVYDGAVGDLAEGEEASALPEVEAAESRVQGIWREGRPEAEAEAPGYAETMALVDARLEGVDVRERIALRTAFERLAKGETLYREDAEGILGSEDARALYEEMIGPIAKEAGPRDLVVQAAARGDGPKGSAGGEAEEEEDLLAKDTNPTANDGNMSIDASAGDAGLTANVSSTGTAETRITNGSFDDLPDNVQAAYNGYSIVGWRGNFSGQAYGTKAAGMYSNDPPYLPSVDSSGQPILYKEFDVDDKIPGAKRNSLRFVVGSDGSVYYTNDHYETFTKIE